MKQYLFFMIGIFMVLNAKAQDVTGFFIRMPNEYMVYLDDAWRKDLVSLYQSGKTATLENTMSGHSTLLKLTSDYLLLQSTDRSTMEIKLLPLVNNTYIACVVTTVNAPAPDSRVQFFSMDWTLLPAGEIWMPATRGGFIKKDADRGSESFLTAASLMDMDLIHYRLSADEPVLTAEYATLQYLNDDDRKKVQPFLNDTPKVYRWKSGRFEN
ncbi:MAG: DUF3256 family protein [Tannerella sp.]|jgi:hypothetical protein|nr:DUF3256 family protein [Tannerella sp.]